VGKVLGEGRVVGVRERLGDGGGRGEAVELGGQVVVLLLERGEGVAKGRGFSVFGVSDMYSTGS